MAAFTVCTSDLPAEGPVEHISHYFIQPHLEEKKAPDNQELGILYKMQ